MNKIFLRPLTIASGLLCSFYAFSSNPITLQSIQKDVSYLASDELNGRGTFTPEIDTAANYIATRFKHSGLQPFKSSYLQKFSIYSFAPNELSLSINNVEIAQEQIALASNAKQIHWSENSDVEITFIKKDDDFRTALKSINQQGGNHLVVVHSTHKKMFKRYQHYFQNGITKLSKVNQGSLMLVQANFDAIEKFSASAQVAVSTKALTNVVAVIPGKSKTNEVILYSAHYDHLGSKPIDDEQDHIFNGADDNASGTTAIINLAQHFAKNRTNERTLIFAAFTAEEIGGYGSKYFSQHIPAENIKAMINIEMVGKPSKFGAGSFWMTGPKRSNLMSLLNDSLKTQQHKVYEDPYPKQQLFYRSDNATLARLGVPAHSFSTTQLDVDQHYHKASDQVDTLDLFSMTQVINNLAIATEALNKGEITPTRVDTSKVKPSGKIF